MLLRLKEKYPDSFYNGHYFLFQGDCLELLREIDSNSVQLIVTSPPYNIGKSYEKKQPIEEYLQFQKQVVKELVRVLSPQGNLCWEVGNYIHKDSSLLPLDYLFYPLFEREHLSLRNRIIWHYGHGTHATKRFSGRYEVILWFTKSKDYVFNLDPVRVPSKYPNKKYYKGAKKGLLSGNPLGKNPSDVWEIPNVKSNHVEKTIHPCQYPVELVERLILSMTNENDLVLDPFLGSGTTAIASLIHHRKVIGSEKNSEYIKISLERMDQLYSEEGLSIRPRERPIWDPQQPHNYIPPKKISLQNIMD